MIALLPSEIARLILNYLEEENLSKTYETFLDECRYLEECKLYLKRGIIVPKTIHGKTLSDYLVIEPRLSEHEKKRPTASIGTQTDEIEKNSAFVECNFYAEPATLSSKRKLSQYDDRLDNQSTELDQESISSSVENYSPSEVEQNASGVKKRRLLIGKNVEKLPELTFSTIERSLDAFISDAASNFCHLTENKTEDSAQKADSVKPDPKQNLKIINSQNLAQQSQLRQNQSILLDLVTGRSSSLHSNQIFSQSQQTPLVILPPNMESPVLPQIQPIAKEPAKSIQPIVIEPFQKVHLTNALNLAGQVVDSNLKAKPNQTKNANIKPKGDTKMDDASVEMFPKKKKVYNRVTPTIRAIYEKEQQNKEESQQKPCDAESKQDDGEVRDVHDEIGDIFGMSCAKTNLNQSDSSDINLDDICVRTNSRTNQDVMPGKKLNKSKKNSGKREDDEVDNFDEKNSTNNETLTSTRTLRSRTNSQRKNF
ncbi:hypothetical protein BpHYR1_016366 [Brachionus plicatilis]|uniref:Uncharacterized protein n=1 Tax=Brachionus plicatilis TaxID=10195 RepID=A0A3M7SWR2_BRAPC|nr:hypothetical protein BpHYR1_016366 [Brachionus plicatilis]